MRLHLPGIFCTKFGADQCLLSTVGVISEKLLEDSPAEVGIAERDSEVSGEQKRLQLLAYDQTIVISASYAIMVPF